MITDNNEQQAPERIRLVKRNGVFDGHWYYPDAAIMPFDTEIGYVRASLAAVPNHALVQLLESALLHPESAEGNIRQVIEILNAAASSPLPADAHRCPHCGRRMVSEFDEDVGFWRECANCDYREQVSSAPAEPEGEHEQWTSDGCGLFRNGAWVTSTAVPEVAATLARKLNERATPPEIPSDNDDLLWVNPTAGVVARHEAGSAFFLYRRVKAAETPVVAREECAKLIDQRLIEISNYQTRPYRVARRELENMARLIRATATTSPSETGVGGEVQHHKHCSIWTVTTSGKKNPCDCVCQCTHSMFEHIRPGEHYWHEDCAVDNCPCMKFITAPVHADGDDEGDTDR